MNAKLAPIVYVSALPIFALAVQPPSTLVPAPDPALISPDGSPKEFDTCPADIAGAGRVTHRSPDGECPDGVVDFKDVYEFYRLYLPTPKSSSPCPPEPAGLEGCWYCRDDVNSDGVRDFDDLLVILNSMGECP